MMLLDDQMKLTYLNLMDKFDKIIAMRVAAGAKE